MRKVRSPLCAAIAFTRVLAEVSDTAPLERSASAAAVNAPLPWMPVPATSLSDSVCAALMPWFRLRPPCAALR
ncbi:hypothetical protein NB689_002173 [Xanthomonas sacchari]|nr:hypothetical protein [Xanthomonas sacchari]